ncbi:MAG: hypothetical protein ABDH63_07265, partial [Candidatus Caldarchaeales archaeon]
PGLLRLEVALHDLKISITDFLGMPVPFAEVSVRGQKESSVSADASGVAELKAIPYGRYSMRVSSLFGNLEKEIEAPVDGGRINPRIPVSPYTLVLLAAASVSIPAVLRGWRRG